MTAGSAILAGLAHRYLQGLLDPFFTLREAHKLMYFLQEAGEPLHLRFARGPDGPYAENFHDVVQAIQGHHAAGKDDEMPALDDPFSLGPDAVLAAKRLLVDPRETRERFDRVAALIDGFESPDGLELLATVHWRIVHDGGRRPEDVIAGVHDWSSRNRPFTPRQIGIAARVLGDQGWIDNFTEAWPT